MQDWRLKTHILGTMHFPKKHTTRNISDSLLNALIDFYVWPKSAEDRIPQSEEAPRSNKLAHFAIETPLDRPDLTNDCGSDVSAGVEKDHFLDCNHCAYPCLSIAIQVAMKSPAIEKFLVRLYSLSSVKAEREIILRDWLMGQNDTAKEKGTIVQRLRWLGGVSMRERPLKLLIG